MSKKQPDVTHNQRVAYTAGWLSHSEGGKKGDSPFGHNTPLHDMWIQGFKDHRKGVKDDTYFKQEVACK